MRTPNNRTKESKLNRQIRHFAERLKQVPSMSHWKVNVSFIKRQIKLTYLKRGKRKARTEFEAIHTWFTNNKLLPEEVELIHLEN